MDKMDKKWRKMEKMKERHIMSHAQRIEMYKQFLYDKAHGETDGSVRDVKVADYEYRRFTCQLEINGDVTEIMLTLPPEFPLSPPQFFCREYNIQCHDFKNSWNPGIKSMCAMLLMIREIILVLLSSRDSGRN